MPRANKHLNAFYDCTKTFFVMKLFANMKYKKIPCKFLFLKYMKFTTFQLTEQITYSTYIRIDVFYVQLNIESENSLI
jgi:hypothetical protein